MIRNERLISFINMIQPGNNNYRNFAPIPSLERCIPTPKHQATKGRLRKEDWNAKAQTIEGWLQLCRRGDVRWKVWCIFWMFPLGSICWILAMKSYKFLLNRSFSRVMPPKTSADKPHNLQQISCKGGGGDTKPQVSSNEIDGPCKEYHEYHECRNLWTYQLPWGPWISTPPP